MKKFKKNIFIKILLLFLLILFNSCVNNIERETIISAKTKVSPLNISIGDDIIYQVQIISKKDIITCE